MFKKKSLILILLLPVFLTGCARAQGALAPTGESSPTQEMAPIESNPDQFLPQVEPASLEPSINYVDGLNLALTGDFSPLRATALVGCGCLAIANRLENLFKSASFTVDCFDAQNNLINRQVLNMGTDDYLQWQNNDEYVITWAAQQLGFVIETPPVPIVEESSP